MGRPLPAAPGRRRLHDAGQGARRRAHRRSGPRDRRRGRRLRRGPRRQRRVRQPLRRHHHPPGHPDPLDPDRRRAPDLGALRRRGAHHRSRPAATRPATCCAARCRGSTPTRPSTPCPWPSPSRPSSPATASTPTCPASSRSASPAACEDCAQAEINDIGLWPARLADGTVGFNVLAGGGLSDGERMASDIDVFVAPEQAVELTRAIAQLFGELGNRENRGLARMRYLVQELGAEALPGRAGGPGPLRPRPGGRGASPALPGRPRRASTPSASPGLRLRGLLRAGRSHVGHRAGGGGPPGPDLRRRHACGSGRDQNFVLTRRARGRASTRCSARSCCRSTRPSPDPSSGAWWPAPAASSAASPWWRRRSGP